VPQFTFVGLSLGKRKKVRFVPVCKAGNRSDVVLRERIEKDEEKKNTEKTLKKTLNKKIYINSIQLCTIRGVVVFSPYKKF